MEACRQLRGWCRLMKHLVLAACLAARDRDFPDVVIADPDLHRAFLNACRVPGLTSRAATRN
jgi:hypothetical protein